VDGRRVGVSDHFIAVEIFSEETGGTSIEEEDDVGRIIDELVIKSLVILEDVISINIQIIFLKVENSIKLGEIDGLVAETTFITLEVFQEVHEFFFDFTGIDISTPNHFSIVNFSSGNFVVSLNLVVGVAGRLEVSKILRLRLGDIESSSRTYSRVNIQVCINKIYLEIPRQLCFSRQWEWY